MPVSFLRQTKRHRYFEDVFSENVISQRRSKRKRFLSGSIVDTTTTVVSFEISVLYLPSQACIEISTLFEHCTIITRTTKEKLRPRNFTTFRENKCQIRSNHSQKQVELIIRRYFDVRLVNIPTIPTNNFYSIRISFQLSILSGVISPSSYCRSNKKKNKKRRPYILNYFFKI